MSSKKIISTTSEVCCTPQQLLGYAQANLSEAAIRQVELHISECDFCGEALDALMSAPMHVQSDLLNNKWEPEEKIIASPQLKATKVKWRAWQIAASLLLIVGVGLGAYRYSKLSNNNTLADAGKSKNTTGELNEVHDLTGTTAEAGVASRTPNENIIAPPPASTTTSRALESIALDKKSTVQSNADANAIAPTTEPAQYKYTPPVAPEPSAAPPVAKQMEQVALNEEKTKDEEKIAATTIQNKPVAQTTTLNPSAVNGGTSQGYNYLPSAATSNMSTPSYDNNNFTVQTRTEKLLKKAPAAKEYRKTNSRGKNKYDNGFAQAKEDNLSDSVLAQDKVDQKNNNNLDALIATKQYSTAEVQLEKTLKSNNNKNSKAWYQLAICRYNLGKKALAIAAMKEAIKDNTAAHHAQAKQLLAAWEKE